MRERAKQQMPMVLLTLLSIIQALALDLIRAHIRAELQLLVSSFASLVSLMIAGAAYVHQMHLNPVRWKKSMILQ